MDYFIAPCYNGQLRLVGGNVQQEGRVEICVGNVWGTVCDDYWNAPDAQVVCRQLGYSDIGTCTFTAMVSLLFVDAVAFSYGHFGTGAGKIYLDDVRCTGSESHLINCTYDSVTTDCSHNEDAGVRCQGILCNFS